MVVYFIRMDRKARIVVPIEIRQLLGISNSETLLLKIVEKLDSKILILLEKADEETLSVRPISKNVREVIQCSEQE